MYNNILLALDLAHKEAHGKALEATAIHAQEGSNVFVVSVIPPLEGGGFIQSFLPDNYDKELIEKGIADLKEFTSQHLKGIEKIKHLVIHGKVYEEITMLSDKLDIDLIITMASIKKDKSSSGFGPNVARVVRNSNCSVLVLR